MRNELSCQLKVFSFMLLSFRVNVVRDLVRIVVLRILTDISLKNASLVDSTLGDPINPNPKSEKSMFLSVLNF